MKRFKRGTALVLGCGPAGLFATHALVMAGFDVRIVSKVWRKSEMFGAQYLHEKIWGLVEEPSTLEYRLDGSVEDYRRKVYGADRVPFVSPEWLAGQQKAYDIRAAYDRAWELYNGWISPIGEIGPETLDRLLEDRKPSRIVSTIPAPALCWRTHGFQSRVIWAIGDAPERGQVCPVRVEPMSIVCNGNENPRWYRASNVYGYCTVEWPDGGKPPFNGVAEVHKPVATDCTCWSEVKGFSRAGRYGKWSKGTLSHEAFYDIAVGRK